MIRISLSQKSTHITALVGVLFFIASVCVYSLFLYMDYKHKEKLSEVRVRYFEIEKHKDVYTDLLNRLDKTSDERKSLTSRILTDEGVVDFLTLIESVGREQGVQLKTNTISVKPINAQFETVVVNVSVEGKYTALMKVLNLFEQLPYQSSLSGILFTGIGDGNTETWKSVYDIQVTKFKS